MITDNMLLTPDQDGYYTVVLSRIGRPDVNGLVKLPLTPTLMRVLHDRAMQGGLHGELGQPRKNASQTTADFMRRCSDIAEGQVSHHIASLEFSQMPDPKAVGGEVMLVRGRIKPAGPFGQVLKTRIEKGEPLHFGMRSFTQQADFASPDMVHRVIQVVTWDLIDNDPYPDDVEVKSITTPAPEVEEPEALMMTRDEWAAAIDAKGLVDHCYIATTLAFLAEQMRQPNSIFTEGLEKPYSHTQPTAFLIYKLFNTENETPNHATIHHLHAVIRKHGWFVTTKVSQLSDWEKKHKNTDCQFEMRHFLSPDPLGGDPTWTPFGGAFGF
jgi:hypothetical protein